MKALLYFQETKAQFSGNSCYHTIIKIYHRQTEIREKWLAGHISRSPTDLSVKTGHHNQTLFSSTHHWP